MSSNRVLVVDDDRDTANTLAQLICVLGYPAEPAYSGSQAIDKLPGYDPELVLLDVAMPNMDGYETAARIRTRPENADKIIVAVTGYGRPDDERKAYSSGFDLHVTKPLSLERLRELLAILK